MERIFTTVISQQQDGQTVASILKQLGFPTAWYAG